MATSILTDCSSFQGSTTSSSSDIMTGTTAASSWCAMPTSTRIRMVRLFRPHTRRVLVTPNATPSYGFSVRGGKEYGTGFFVSTVDHNSEAEQKGLRIGDQILRINGFRIDDAIHKEFCQLVSSQDRLVLKVRSVGMLPTKDNDADGLSWSVVKAPSISSTPSECSFQSTTSTDNSGLRNRNERVVNIVLNVAPRTKLGLGICKGPEWKPGIFVQFTKEKSVAREAGLRPGDQILTVNSIDFSDVLFSEAVAVMKSSNKLDMTVHKGAGCDLFPGESSGYNSSASSVTGDQSPCWGDVKSKRLTSVREESTIAATPPSPPHHSSSVAKHNSWNQALYENEPRSRSKSNAERSTRSTDNNSKSNATLTNITKSHKEINKTIIKLSESGTSINNTFVANTPHSGSSTDTLRNASGNYSDISSSYDYNAATLTKNSQPYSEIHKNTPPVPPPIAIQNSVSSPTMHQNSSSHPYTHKEAPVKVGGLASTMQRYASLGNYVAINELPSSNTQSTNNEMKEIPGSPPTDSCSLSNAITEELKKRKAKRQPSSQPSQRSDVLTTISEQKSPKPQNTLIGAGDQHSALMNEFKQAHKRMFKNGFRDSVAEENKDRQEALKRTTMMDDPTTYRAQGTKQPIDHQNQQSTRNENNNHNSSHIPKPPPMQPLSSNNSGNNNLNQQNPPQKFAMMNTQNPSAPLGYSNERRNVAFRSPSSASSSSNGLHLNEIQYRNSNKNSTSGGINQSNTTIASSSSNNTNRQTLRLGTVTIGEYHKHGSLKEPEKFDFIAMQGKRQDSGDTTPTNETLQSELHSTLSRSKLKKTNNNNGSPMEHQRNCPLHQQQHSHHNQHQQQQQPMQHHQSQNYNQNQNHYHHQHPPAPPLQQQHLEYQNVNFNTFTVSEITQKLQKSSLNGGVGGNVSSSSPFNSGPGVSNNGQNHHSSIGGILKNGNRNHSSHNSSNKSTEKSIKFG
ncbi:uncharacterized protein LOC142231540 [Haematobia irritans]|uniref:uncharacterized protein LOC142231540 n=1 Tax=Haematobia irritans TaxID=7368 RepID=UPI003F4F5579